MRGRAAPKSHFASLAQQSSAALRPTLFTVVAYIDDGGLSKDISRAHKAHHDTKGIFTQLSSAETSLDSQALVNLDDAAG